MNGDRFETTCWSVVLAAGDRRSTVSHKALSTLCQDYWQPLYFFVRRKGYWREEAEDLTQEFFTQFLERGSVGGADREKGRFRTYLLASLNHFLANEWEKRRALKRGGGKLAISFDFEAAEERQGGALTDSLTPEKIFERQWVQSLLDKVLNALEQEYENSGNARLFKAIKVTLTHGRPAARYHELGKELGMSEGALKVAVHRLKKKYRQKLREEVAQTVGEEDSVEHELRHMMTILGS